MSEGSRRFVESMEQRQLFAVQPIQLLAQPWTGERVWPSALVVEPAATPSAPAEVGATPQTPVVRSTDLVGLWDGAVRVKIVLFKKNFDAEIRITKQTDTELTGSIEIKGHDFSGTFEGRIKPETGRFRWKVEDDGDSIEIVGRLNTAGTKIVGDIDAEYAGFEADGSFEFVKKKNG